MAACEQCLLRIASGGFFGQQGFRDAYQPTVQEGYAQCNQTLPTLKRKYGHHSRPVWRAHLPLTAHKCTACDANLFAVLISILSSLCSYCFVFVVCFFYLTLRQNSLKTTTPFQSCTHSLTMQGNDPLANTAATVSWTKQELPRISPQPWKWVFNIFYSLRVTKNDSALS